MSWIIRHRWAIACAAVGVLIVAGYVTFSFVHVGSDGGNGGSARECVNTTSMKVAASARCRDWGGSGSGSSGAGVRATAGVYAWYYGSPVTQVGGLARGGSFDDPGDDQEQSNQNGSGGSGAGSGGGSGGDDG